MSTCSCGNFRKILSMTILIGATAWIVWSTAKQMHLRQSIVGQPADAFLLESFDGQQVGYQPQRLAVSGHSSKRTILVFWATWCPECKNMLARFEPFYKDFIKNDIDVYVINAGEPRKLLERFFRNKKLPFPILLDERSKTANAYHVWGVPTFVFINEKGIITAVTHAISKKIPFEKAFQLPST